MTSPRTSRSGTARTRRTSIVVFGESDNDRRAIRELVLALCPGAEVEVLRSPQVLIKGARPETIPTSAAKIVDAVRARNAHRTVHCTFAHQDADEREPQDAAANAMEAALRLAGCPGLVFAVIPAWELETWWFMWPGLVASIRGAWQPPVSKRAIGEIANAKEALRDAVRPTGMSARDRKRFPNYRESDSIEIAKLIREQGRASEPPLRASPSYDRFRESVRSCCSR